VPTAHDSVFAGGLTLLQGAHGRSATYTPVDSSTGTAITVLFQEFVGAIDHIARAIFVVSSAVVTTPRRGDKIALNGDTWFVVDVRGDNTAAYELRCDRSQED
jgi:hypothetical protein